MSALTGMAADRRIPVVVLTGFLGAGKTTLLNHLIHQAGFADSAVLINEFGKVGIDHHLVEKIDDNILLLDSGCLCCSVRGDLARALRELAQRRLRRDIPAFARVLIETTGLADPAPVIQTLCSDFFLAERFRPAGILTAIAAPHAEQQLSNAPEAACQVAMADHLLLTQCDLAPGSERSALRQRLARLNPEAALTEVLHGALDPDVVHALIQSTRLPTPILLTPPAAPDHDHPHEHADAHAPAPGRHDSRVSSFVLRFAEPFVPGDFAEALDVLLATCGDRLLRIKGLVNLTGSSQPRLIQCVHHVRYPEQDLPAWPDDDHHSRLVFIVRDFERQYVEKAFAMFCGVSPVAGS